MEESLDKIAAGELALLDYMNNFYSNLKSIVDSVSETGLATDIPEKVCPECGKALVVRRSRFGKLFYGCNYPKCKYTESIQ
jgi:DNA topoisomerase-1